jgi:hypothetical protein
MPSSSDAGHVLDENHRRPQGRNELRSIEEQARPTVVTPPTVLAAERLAGRADYHQVQRVTAEAVRPDKIRLKRTDVLFKQPDCRVVQSVRGARVWVVVDRSDDAEVRGLQCRCR